MRCGGWDGRRLRAPQLQRPARHPSVRTPGPPALPAFGHRRGGHPVKDAGASPAAGPSGRGAWDDLPPVPPQGPRPLPL